MFNAVFRDLGYLTAIMVKFIIQTYYIYIYINDLLTIILQFSGIQTKIIVLYWQFKYKKKKLV